MSIEPFSLVVVLTIGLAVGALAAWLVARVGQSRLRAELERDCAVQSERLRAHEDVGTKFRETFQALSADALTANNRAFLDLAEATAPRCSYSGGGGSRASQAGGRESSRADGQDARAGRPRDQGVGAAPHTERFLIAAAHRLARYRRPGSPGANRPAGRRTQTSWCPRPLGRAAAEARRRAGRHGRALRLRGTAHGYSSRSIAACVPM